MYYRQANNAVNPVAPTQQQRYFVYKQPAQYVYQQPQAQVRYQPQVQYIQSPQQQRYIQQPVQVLQYQYPAQYAQYQRPVYQQTPYQQVQQRQLVKRPVRYQYIQQAPQVAYVNQYQANIPMKYAQKPMNVQNPWNGNTYSLETYEPIKHEVQNNSIVENLIRIAFTDNEPRKQRQGQNGYYMYYN